MTHRAATGIVQVRVATVLERKARLESQQLAQLEVMTTYDALRRFARQLQTPS